MAGSPIKIGSAALAALIPGIPSRIVTDEFGVQHGQLPYQLGDQTISQNLRLTQGTLYNGTLPQFNGFFVERSGDITGREAGAAIVEVQYAQIDPKFIILPSRSHDLQIVTVSAGDLSGFNQIFETLQNVIIPIPHPVITYKFSATTVPGKLGQFSQNPGNAPTIGQYIYSIEIFNFISPGAVTVEQKTISINATTFILDPSSNTCTKTTTPVSVTAQGVFVQNNLNFINPFNIIFSPGPNGWQCLREDAQPICGGQIYLIEQQWKMLMVASGMTPGTFWANAIPVHCT